MMTRISQAILDAHAQFGGDLVDMQRRYDAASSDRESVMDDYYLAETVHGEIVRVRNLPNTMKEPVAQWHPGVMRALSEKPIQTSDTEEPTPRNQAVIDTYRAMDAVDAIRKWCDEQQYENDTITVAKLRAMLPH
jgi:hypothetical protein